MTTDGRIICHTVTHTHADQQRLLQQNHAAFLQRRLSVTPAASFSGVGMEVWSSSASEEDDDERSVSSFAEETVEEERKCLNNKNNNNNNNNKDSLCREVTQGEMQRDV